MNTLDLKQRVAIITGGARGIGYAAAERMLQSGAIVALWDVDADAAVQAVASLSAFGTVSADHVELTDEYSVTVATEAVIRQWAVATSSSPMSAGVAG